MLQRYDPPRMATTERTDSPVTPGRVAVAGAVVSFLALAYVGVLLFDDVAFGVVIGALTGVGSYFLLEYVFRGVADDGRDDAATDSFHRGAVGYAFSASGVVALAAMFVVENPALAVGVALALAATEYAVFSRFLPREFGADEA